IFFVPPYSEKVLFDQTIANAEEIKAREGFIVGFGFDELGTFTDESIRLQGVHWSIAPLLLLILGQLFAYYSAVALNRNVDKPRSLAKSVTVA
ncbi:glutamine--fructose-6-phosphate transaminase (isomerizing), partial [bacterium]|nr:glutamine--fructose-6-phosphate transaminase (isomerizing) [candidate division CSSED10-310 bacterium]